MQPQQQELGGTATTVRLLLQFPQSFVVAVSVNLRLCSANLRGSAVAVRRTPYLGIAAIHSTSSFAVGVTSAATTTVERAGGGFSGDQNFE